MQLWDIISTLDATSFARDVYLPDALPNNLNQFLPDRSINGIRSQVARRTRTRTTAMYRAFNAETPIGQRNEKIAVTEVNLPPVGQKLMVTEWERLWLQFATSGNSGIDAMIEQIYDDIENNVDAIRNRLEIARGDLLADGKFTLIAENGLTVEADYGLTADQLPTASASWGATGTDILDMESEWLNTFTHLSGVQPAQAIVSLRTRQRMQKNVSYRNAYWAGTATTGPNLSIAQLNQVREDQGLPALYVYDHQLISPTTGQSVRVLPQDQYILTGATVGETQFGVTAESLELVGSNAVDFTITDAPGIFAATYKEPDPVTGWTKATAVAMPILADSTQILSADTDPTT